MLDLTSSKTCDSAVETANVTNHVHGRVNGGRPRRRLETEEVRARRTVERDAADVHALSKSLPGVRLITSIIVTVAQMLHNQWKMRSDDVKSAVNV